MKTLIVYGTKYGCAGKCAQLIAQELEGEVDVVELKGRQVIDLNPYQKVIIGGSIYLGKIQKEVREFCKANIAPLMTKDLALFIVCMQTGEVAEQELNQAFPAELVTHAMVKASCGGEMIFAKMKAMDRFIAKKVAKSSQDVFDLKQANIRRIAQSINSSQL